MSAERRLSPWKVALLAPLPLLALLLLLEGTLWLFGLGDPDERLSLTRGFSESARYLLPDPEQPGGYITQTSDGSLPEQVIAPKGERLRVLLFGGSLRSGPLACLCKLTGRALFGNLKIAFGLVDLLFRLGFFTCDAFPLALLFLRRLDTRGLRGLACFFFLPGSLDARRLTGLALLLRVESGGRFRFLHVQFFP